MLPPILLIGHGRMGSAMLAGWRERGIEAAFAVDPAADGSDPSVVTSIPAGFTPAAVVLAVKPQMAWAALPSVARFQGAVFLSIMAGRTVASLEAALCGAAPPRREVAIVRAMPNTPAAIRKGISVAFAGPGTSETQRSLCDNLLRAVGEVAWTEDEGELDAVTALSGGGPAYVFLLAEVMEAAGIAQGLSPTLSRQLARVTISGAGALLAASDEDAAALRRAVTSPAGTTERALAVLMEREAWPALMERAITAATLRSRELAG